jgi:TPR repeat protein
MMDIRAEIVGLAENCIHLLLEQRIDSQQSGKEWKKGLPDFVESNYKCHKPNYLALKTFFEKHELDEFDLEDYDITALRPLINYYKPLKEILREGLTDEEYKVLDSKANDVCEVRNTLDHYPQKISEAKEREFCFDQMDSVCAIIRLSLFCECKHIGEGRWREIIEKAFYYQGMLRREKWFISSKDKKYDVSPESDYSELEFAANSGNEEAQIILGKMHYEGTRYGLDSDKAFMWLYKVARKQKNAEAMYYLGKCYQNGSGVECDENKGVAWIKRAADDGYAPAQYEIAYSDWVRNNVTAEEKKRLAMLLKLSAEQGYLPAIWVLGLSYGMGFGVEKDSVKAEHLKEKAALLGYKPACEELAKEARRKKDTESEKKWKDLAKKTDSRKEWP